MDACDVIVVGGGPAGSACAGRLRQAGLEAVVIDKAVFPRDKVCAGWITPPVLAALAIDAVEYGRGRTLQPITGFHVGTIGRRRGIDVSYRAAVSFGIRRAEFDAYLLERAAVRTATGEAVRSIRRDGTSWVVNERIRAPVIVGAGGHFCPVARMANPGRSGAPIVSAQEVEVPIADAPCEVDAQRPELYFSRDLRGYGWCLRKGGYLNVGLGQFDGRALPASVARFARFLQQIGRLATDVAAWKWRGHAYAVGGEARATLAGDGFVLIGDAAGLARPLSGEGIRPAIESGLLAAETIAAAGGRYTADRLAPYAAAIRSRFGRRWMTRAIDGLVPMSAATRAALRLFDRPWFVRHVVIDRWFLDAA